MKDPDGNLSVQNCGGRDLSSNPVLVSVDEKHIFCCGDKRVTIFSIETGQPIRELGTGPIVSLAISKDNPSHLLVARANDLVTWDYEIAKIVRTEPYFEHPEFGFHDAVIPNDYLETKEIFAIDDNYSLHKVNLSSQTSYVLPKKIYAKGSLHVGDNDNCVVAICRAKTNMNVKNNNLVVYDRNLDKFESMLADWDRALTIVRCHPLKKIIACGDTNGRVIIHDARDSKKNLRQCPKDILHWHFMGVRSLAFSLEGSHIYSGGDEQVLCIWLPESKKPHFRQGRDHQLLASKCSQLGWPCSYKIIP